jgi:hypothetical protein
MQTMRSRIAFTALAMSIGLLTAAVASAFFNPVGRPQHCVLQLSWDAQEPEAASVALVAAGPFPTTRVCSPTRLLALASALQREIKEAPAAEDAVAR